MRSSMIGVRDTAAVFKYLDYTPVGGGEWMWNKFMRPSNWADLVCNDFDAAYAAATLNANRRPAGEPRYNDPQTGARFGKMRWLGKRSSTTTSRPSRPKRAPSARRPPRTLS